MQCAAVIPFDRRMAPSWRGKGERGEGDEYVLYYYYLLHTESDFSSYSSVRKLSSMLYTKYNPIKYGKKSNGRAFAALISQFVWNWMRTHFDIFALMYRHLTDKMPTLNGIYIQIEYFLSKSKAELPFWYWKHKNYTWTRHSLDIHVSVVQFQTRIRISSFPQSLRGDWFEFIYIFYKIIILCIRIIVCIDISAIDVSNIPNLCPSTSKWFCIQCSHSSDSVSICRQWTGAYARIYSNSSFAIIETCLCCNCFTHSPLAKLTAASSEWLRMNRHGFIDLCFRWNASQNVAWNPNIQLH